MNKKSCVLSRNFTSIYKINRTLHGHLGIRILSHSCWKYLSLVRFAHSWEILSALEDKIRIPARLCNILYLIYSVNFIYKKQFLGGMYNIKDILGTRRQTWKLYNTARLISTKALSFQREEKLFVSSPIRFATGYESRKENKWQHCLRLIKGEIDDSSPVISQTPRNINERGQSRGARWVIGRRKFSLHFIIHAQFDHALTRFAFLPPRAIQVETIGDKSGGFNT